MIYQFFFRSVWDNFVGLLWILNSSPNIRMRGILQLDPVR